MDDYHSDISSLARPTPLFYQWLKARILALGVMRMTVYTTLLMCALSGMITWISKLCLIIPEAYYPISMSFSLGVPLLVAPPTVWIISQCMVDADVARRVAERMAATDALTQTFNRRYFFHVGEPALARSQADGQALSVLLLDVDHFKSVNDRHGHAMGDEVLKQVAQACQRCARAQDVLARFGGEEFVLLLPGLTVEDAQAVAERLRVMVEALAISLPDGAVVRPTVSVGVATVQIPGPGMDELIAAADAAMYRAKQDGRNRVAIGQTWLQQGQLAAG